MQVPSRLVLAVGLLCLALTGTAAAQGYDTDARLIGMGGSAVDGANIAAGMVEKSTPAMVIPVPIGLIQVFKGGTDKFNPGSNNFDPVRALESATSPMHYTFGATTDSTGGRFINDLVNGRLSRNLASYAGFNIPTSLSVQGLASPNAGGTIKFKKSDSAFQGIYIGAGPYLGVDTDLTVDPALADTLANGVNRANASMFLRNNSAVQLALSITLGYRARIALGSGSGAARARDGLYVAYNYRILRGLEYLQPDVTVRFDTDAAGNITLAPTTTPIAINSLRANTGSGRASDVGVQVVRGIFEAGFGLKGIGNQIDWTDFTLTTYTLPSLSSANGQSFIERPGTPSVSNLSVKLPVVKSANVGVEASGWAARAMVADGFNGKSFHGGVEKQLGAFWIRGGGKYSREKWDPTYGFGIGRRVVLDVAFYGSHGNLEGERRTTMAVSLRFNRGR
jgi:hypothetical protein